MKNKDTQLLEEAYDLVRINEGLLSTLFEPIKAKITEKLKSLFTSLAESYPEEAEQLYKIIKDKDANALSELFKTHQIGKMIADSLSKSAPVTEAHRQGEYQPHLRTYKMSFGDKVKHIINAIQIAITSTRESLGLNKHPFKIGLFIIGILCFCAYVVLSGGGAGFDPSVFDLNAIEPVVNSALDLGQYDKIAATVIGILTPISVLLGSPVKNSTHYKQIRADAIRNGAYQDGDMR